MNILLVEDNEDNRFIIRAYFKNTPHRIDMAENGLIALEKVKNSDFDIILMDVRMPVLGGYEATARIRQWEAELELTPTPILALTAHASDEDARKSRAAGCNGHLSKPIRKKDLLAAMAAHVGLPSSGKTGSAPSPEPPPVSPDRRISVPVDPELEELVPVFLGNRTRDINEMRQALEIEDFETVGTIGHGMKGAGGSYGFNRISELGRDLESAADQKDRETCLRLVDELHDYLERVDIVYRITDT